MNPDTIGVDLGGTHLRVALVDCTGAIGHDLRIETPKDGWRSVISALAEGITKVADAGRYRIVETRHPQAVIKLLVPEGGAIPSDRAHLQFDPAHTQVYEDGWMVT
jgi:hypothetical protein